MKKNVSLFLFVVAIATIASAFYLTRNSEASTADPVKQVGDGNAVVFDSVEVRK